MATLHGFSLGYLSSFIQIFMRGYVRQAYSHDRDKFLIDELSKAGVFSNSTLEHLVKVHGEEVRECGRFTDYDIFVLFAHAAGFDDAIRSYVTKLLEAETADNSKVPSKP